MQRWSTTIVMVHGHICHGGGIMCLESCLRLGRRATMNPDHCLRLHCSGTIHPDHGICLGSGGRMHPDHGLRLQCLRLHCSGTIHPDHGICLGSGGRMHPDHGLRLQCRGMMHPEHGLRLQIRLRLQSQQSLRMQSPKSRPLVGKDMDPLGGMRAMPVATGGDPALVQAQVVLMYSIFAMFVFSDLGKPVLQARNRHTVCGDVQSDMKTLRLTVALVIVFD